MAAIILLYCTQYLLKKLKPGCPGRSPGRAHVTYIHLVHLFVISLTLFPSYLHCLFERRSLKSTNALARIEYLYYVSIMLKQILNLLQWPPVTCLDCSLHHSLHYSESLVNTVVIHRLSCPFLWTRSPTCHAMTFRSSSRCTSWPQSSWSSSMTSAAEAKTASLHNAVVRGNWTVSKTWKARSANWYDPVTTVHKSPVLTLGSRVRFSRSHYKEHCRKLVSWLLWTYLVVSRLLAHKHSQLKRVRNLLYS